MVFIGLVAAATMSPANPYHMQGSGDNGNSYYCYLLSVFGITCCNADLPPSLLSSLLELTTGLFLWLFVPL
jgi:hypothetical protein